MFLDLPFLVPLPAFRRGQAQLQTRRSRSSMFSQKCVRVWLWTEKEET